MSDDDNPLLSAGGNGPLEKSQTGDVELPKWAYTSDVLFWAQWLSRRDEQAIKQIEVYEGFVEHCHRFVFAYEDTFVGKHPNLITILPSGIIENNEVLDPMSGRCLITYAHQQSMEPEVAVKFKAGPAAKFVWERRDGTYGLVQTWPAKFNDKFKKDFKMSTYPTNPDPEHFDAVALEDFKRVMIDLFNLQGKPDEEPLPIKLAHKQTENRHRVYCGTGEALMSVLRLRQDVREHMKIFKVVEPSGFKCLNLDGEQVKTIKKFNVDFTLPYCLYIREGNSKMACVKPKDQFLKECIMKEEVKEPFSEHAADVLSCPMDIDWFSETAHFWALRGATVVWGCAFSTIPLRLAGKWGGIHHISDPVVIIATALVAAAYGLRADFMAMKSILVPWLQRVKKLDMGVNKCIKVKFRQFLLVSFASTAIQTFTIQLNTRFMLDMVQVSDQMLDAWEFLWTHSLYSFLPDSTWKIITPARVAICFWLLSTGQLVSRLMVSLPWKAPKNLFPKPGKEGENFEPEAHYCDFWTPWAMLKKRLGFWAKKCTYRESVCSLALASGLRYTLSTSISYPEALINETIDNQRGYRSWTGTGFQPCSHGWELRALLEFRKIRKMMMSRLLFIMLFKLALQTNLQITLLIIQLWNHGDGLLYHMLAGHNDEIMEDFDRDNLPALIAPAVSIASLILSMFTELKDLWRVARIFKLVHAHARAKISKINENDLGNIYAQDDFISIEHGEDEIAKPIRGKKTQLLWAKRTRGTKFFTSLDTNEAATTKDEEKVQVARIEYTYKDLKAEYKSARRSMCRMVVVTSVSIWLVGYALLKFFASRLCKSGAWTMPESCLNVTGLAEQLVVVGS